MKSANVRKGPSNSTSSSSFVSMFFLTEDSDPNLKLKLVTLPAMPNEDAQDRDAQDYNQIPPQTLEGGHTCFIFCVDDHMRSSTNAFETYEQASTLA